MVERKLYITKKPVDEHWRNFSRAEIKTFLKNIYYIRALICLEYSKYKDNPQENLPKLKQIGDIMNKIDNDFSSIVCSRDKEEIIDIIREVNEEFDIDRDFCIDEIRNID